MKKNHCFPNIIYQWSTIYLTFMHFFLLFSFCQDNCLRVFCKIYEILAGCPFSFPCLSQIPSSTPNLVMHLVRANMIWPVTEIGCGIWGQIGLLCSCTLHLITHFISNLTWGSLQLEHKQETHIPILFYCLHKWHLFVTHGEIWFPYVHSMHLHVCFTVDFWASPQTDCSLSSFSTSSS